MKPTNFALIASVLLATGVAAANDDTATKSPTPWFQQDSLTMRDHALFDEHAAPIRQVALGKTVDVVPFAFDSARVDFDLTNVADQLRADTSTTIVLDAHADPIGASTYNVALSLRRAENVRDRLVRLGVDQHRIVMGVYGEDGKSAGSYAADRRVTIRTSAASVKEIVDSRLDPATAVIFGEAHSETALNDATPVNGRARL